jgi:pimeloyl-ACP methyl ester carboxylesterase
LVVAGRVDAVIPLQEAEAVAGAFPNSRLLTLEASGHMPMLEEPDRVSEALEAFLNG